MQTCQYELHIENVSNHTLQAFDENVAKIPDHLCGAFYEAARELEAQLITIYRFVISIVDDLDEMETEGTMWKEMVKVCDKFSGKLESLVNNHPTCGAGFYRDRILDLRNKCNRLAKLHS